MDLEKYRTLFVDEARDHLCEMGTALVTLESGPDAGDAGEAVDLLFRMAHSIKGMAASLDFESVAALAHRFEDWMEPFRAGQKVHDTSLVLLGEAIGALEVMVGAVEETGAPTPADPALLARLAEPPAAPSEASPETAAPDAPARCAESLVAAPANLPRTVRVRTALVDRFLASVGELLQRQEHLEALHRGAPYWARHREFGEELDRMEHVVRELRRRALDIRTTSVRRVLERLPMVASEIARSLGKRVRVERSGEEVEVDRAILDHLDDPLLHLVRNAVDHGIETPDERRAAGKDPMGTIRLAASCAAGRLHIRFEEDGRGIDIEAVRRRAIKRGLILEMVAEDLPPERIVELIFEPGISTRAEVSDISGRGVGMDAVKRTVESLGGTLSIRSVRGEGTVFDLDLPAMVALQRVLVLELAGERVAVPLAQIEAVLGADDTEMERGGGGSEAFFMYKDEPLPLLDLAEEIGLPPAESPRGCNLLVLEIRGFRLGLLVYRTAGSVEVFVRDVPAPLAEIPSLGGVAILPDGDPVFLLEPGALVERFL